MPTANIAYSAMAVHVSGGWSSYAMTEGYFGVTSSVYRSVVLRFTAPTYTGIATSLSITVPIALSWTDSSGAVPCYYSLTATDPTTLGTVYAASSPGTDSGRIASGTASITGSTSSVFYWTFTMSPSSLESGGTYYLVLSANGTAYSAYVYANSTYAVTGTLTYAYPASEPTLSSDTIEMGSAVTIATNRTDSSYTHTITYAFGSASGTIGTDVGASVSWTPPLTLANEIPNAASGVGTITCMTYSGSALYGTKTVQFTLTVPASIVPSISSFTAAQVDDGSAPYDWGIYVRGVSKAKLTTLASGAYSSTITSYAITGGLSGAEVTTGTLTTAGTNTWTVTVTDSRGRTATASVSVDVVDYAIPSIRGALFERCDADGTPNDDGTYLQVKATISISDCDGCNSYTATVLYKLQTGSTWETAGSYDASGEMQVYDVSLADEAYDVQLVVTDAIQTVYTGTTLDIGVVLADYDPDTGFFTWLCPLILDGGMAADLDMGGYNISNAYIISATDRLNAQRLELSQATPYIDFHYAKSTSDYTQRIISNSASGNLAAYPGISSSSDARLKNSIVDLPDIYTALFDALDLREYRLNKGNGLRIGLIAQEILAAEESLGITESVIVSGTGKELDNGTIDYHAVDYDAVLILAMAKIKQMDTEIQALKKEIGG